jgi:hypothetical protein
MQLVQERTGSIRPRRARALAPVFPHPHTGNGSLLSPWHLAIVTLVALAAADSATAQDGRIGSIAGIAADSLHHRALAGALITVEDLGRSAVTDTAGVFLIDSIPPGDWRLSVFHPLLDSLGISLVTRTLTVTADAPLYVVLAVPTATSLLVLKCGSDTAAAIVGTVSIADDPVRPSVGHMELSWMEALIGRGIGIRHTPQSVRAPINENGMFHLCGIPPDVSGDLVAVSGRDTSAALTVSFLDSPWRSSGLCYPARMSRSLKPRLIPRRWSRSPGWSHPVQRCAAARL